MDKSEMEQAVKGKLSKRELYVLFAYKLGYTDTYGIQQFTGLRRDVVIETAQNMQSKRDLNKLNTNLYEVPAQNVQNVLSPPQELTQYMRRMIGLATISSYPRDLSTMKQAYLLAYEQVGRSQDKALWLVKDCLDEELPTLKSKTAAGPYFLACFRSYLRSVPKQPTHVWEAEQRDGKHRRWIRKTNKWELA